MKLSNDKLRKIIAEEMAMLIKDDAIFKKRDIPGDLDDEESSEDYSESSCSVCGEEYGSCGHYGEEEYEDEDFESEEEHHHHHKGESYMAKPQLMKIARYAQSLHDMIPEGMALDDWQESHIAQLADDIGEVYHSLEYKLKYKK